MRVILECVGSAGDVHPFVGIGRTLVGRGHDVTLLANEVFRGPVESAGIEFVPSGPPDWFEESTNHPDLWHPLRGPRVVLGGVMEYVFEPTVQTLLALVAERPSDTVLVGSTLAFAGHCVAEAQGLPFVSAHLAPSIFRSDHHAPRLPGLVVPDWAPRWCRRLLYRLSDVVIDRLLCPRLNAVRARLGLPPVARVFHTWLHEGAAVLALFPEWFAMPQADWPSVTFAGFPLFDEAAARPVDADLAAWLDRGSPPLVFTHGSANVQGRRFFEVAAGAARALGRRALLVTVEAEAVRGLTSDDVRHAAYVPFSRVAPRAAVFVGHGGIGTTAQGLVAGVPQLVVPMGFDQFDNGARVVALGCGSVVPSSRWTVPRATAALEHLMSDHGVTVSSRSVASRFAASRACEVASDVIEGCVG